MVENSFLFGSLTKSCCGRIHESLGKLIVIFYVALTVIGGHLSAVNAGATGRTSPRSPKPDQSVRCGPYAVCDLASHYCDTVMNTCVRCSDDCHPGRINGDSLAEEDCKIKCRVYYELKEEIDRLIAEETKETTYRPQPIVNHHHRSDEKYLQLSFRSLHLINAADDKTLARVELLMAIETIAVAVITILLFIISICLIILLQRQRVRTVYSYTPLDTGRKTASG